MLHLVSVPLWNGGLDSESKCYQQVKSLRNVVVSQDSQDVIDDKNKEQGSRVNRKYELFNTIKKKTVYLGHVPRSERYQFLQLIIEEKIEDRRDIERKKMSWLRNLR